MMYRIGVDLGGTKISAAVVDDTYRILTKVTCPTEAKRPADDITASIASLCKKAAEEANVGFENIESIGIGIPGAIDARAGMIEYSCNLPTYISYPIVDKMKELTGNCNIYIDNDANAAALGEVAAGAAKGASSCVMITLGTGVGGGIVIDGKILPSFNGAGGELGHTVIVHGGVPCPCGRRGCFEAYSSATSLVRMTKERLTELKAASIPTLMLGMCSGDPENANTRTAFDASKQGDSEAIKLIGEYTEYLACGIINLINIFQPNVFLIGGGVCNEGEPLLRPLREEVAKRIYAAEPILKTDIRIATLGNDAGIIGAAALVRSK
jgi:glucokinase